MNKSLVFVLLSAIIAFFFGIIAAPLFSPNEINHAVATDDLAEVKEVYYTCPMHTHILQDNEGD